MQEHTSECVIKAFDTLEETLGKSLFAEVFQTIITDNGAEFSNIDGIERSLYGGKRTSLFFCEPNRSDQKGAAENNHKLIRTIIPKGDSMEPFSQADISLMMNHINSYKRKSIMGKCPYDLARTLLPEDFFLFLGLENIPPEDIVLKPSLLRKLNEPA